MKQFIKIVFTIVLSLFLFTGCSSSLPAGNSQNNNPSDLPENSVVEVQTEEESEPIMVEKPAVEEPVLEEGEIIVHSISEFQNALENKEVKIIRIDSEIELDQEISFEREDDLEIHIVEEGVLVINENFTPVGCIIQNDGQILVYSSFERGISSLNNQGSLVVKSGGTVSSGMSNTENYGSFILESGAELSIDRGSIFNNLGELKNGGHISVDNGGQLNAEGGTISNDGTLDIYSFYNGEISEIGGNGTINDFREE